MLATTAEFADLAQTIAASDGPIFVDVERASTYRYGDRAFLIQLKTPGSGTALVDPEANSQDIGPLADALSSSTVCLHSCRSDLPSLRALGVNPRQLHDTEIAAKMLATQGFGLGTLVDAYLGIHLPKAYSRADWSLRPLPLRWLEYALDDVEYLDSLLEMLIEDLETVPVQLPAYYPARLRGENRAAWYAESMADMLNWEPAPPIAEPWRRLSNLSSLRDSRELARARALWQARENIGAHDDIAVHRIVADASLISAARNNPRSSAQIKALPGFSGQIAAAHAGSFISALRTANKLPEQQLPPRRAARPASQRPSHRQWKLKAPNANTLLTVARELLSEVSEVATVETQTLLASAHLRQWVWAAAHAESSGEFASTDEDLIHSALTEAGALPWQVRMVAPALQRALHTMRAELHR